MSEALRSSGVLAVGEAVRRRMSVASLDIASSWRRTLTPRIRVTEKCAGGLGPISTPIISKWRRSMSCSVGLALAHNKRMQRTGQSDTHFAKRKMRATLPCR